MGLDTPQRSRVPAGMFLISTLVAAAGYNALTMRDNSETPGETGERRKRGRRPGDATARRAAVERALTDLTSARVPFSMGDLAERAGISRATLYRDAGLRDLVGGAGDGPANRPVNARDFRRLETEAAKLGEERKTLRRDLRVAERSLREAQDRIERMEADRAATARERRGDTEVGQGAAEKIKTQAFAEGFAAGARAYQQRGGGRTSGGTADLLSAASRLPRAAMLTARKTLARALHPDLYASDPATALLATELLKQINALAASNG